MHPSAPGNTLPLSAIPVGCHGPVAACGSLSGSCLHRPPLGVPSVNCLMREAHQPACLHAHRYRVREQDSPSRSPALPTSLPRPTRARHNRRWGMAVHNVELRPGAGGAAGARSGCLLHANQEGCVSKGVVCMQNNGAG